MRALYVELIRPRTQNGFTLMEGAYWLIVGGCLAALAVSFNLA